MSEMTGRALIEARYGPIGCGARVAWIAGTVYTIDEVLFRLGLNFDDSKPIDLLTLENRYVVRYCDGQDGRLVAQEFDEQFRLLEEIRGNLAEWTGEDAYFSEFSGH
jgi:hypothetical protein